MKQCFSGTSDRYGHIITGLGGSAQTKALFVLPKPEQVGLFPEAGQSAAESLQNRRFNQPPFWDSKKQSPIRKILIPIDAEHTEPADLKPFLELAQRLDAEITLLHCYTTPPSFDYAVGPSALAHVSLHRDTVKARLTTLCSNVRKFFTKCRCEFELGSLPTTILRASDRVRADLIAVPLSLDFVSDCWTTSELLDELVRRANCPVLGVPSARR